MVTVLIVIPIVGRVKVGHGTGGRLTLLRSQLMDGDKVITVNIFVTVAVDVILGHVRLNRLLGTCFVESAALVIRPWSASIGPVSLGDQIGTAELIEDTFDVFVTI